MVLALCAEGPTLYSVQTQNSGSSQLLSVLIQSHVKIIGLSTPKLDMLRGRFFKIDMQY